MKKTSKKDKEIESLKKRIESLEKQIKSLQKTTKVLIIIKKEENPAPVNSNNPNYPHNPGYPYWYPDWYPEMKWYCDTTTMWEPLGPYKIIYD